MSQAEMQQVLERYVEAKNRQDVEAALALCHEDCSYESVGLGEPVRGKEALRQFYGALFQSLPDYFGEFDRVVLGDGVSASCGRFGGTTAGDFMGLPVPAGRAVSVPVTFVCTFRDGLLASDAGYFDAALLCAQAGVPLGLLRPAPGDEFVERFADFWAAPDADLVPDLVDDAVTARFPGVEGPVEGLAAYRAQIAGALAAVPDLRIEVLDHLAEGDRVAIEWRGRGTVAGEALELDGVDRFRLRDGKVVDARIVYDTAPLAAAFERAAAAAA